MNQPFNSNLTTQNQKSRLSFPKGLGSLPLCLAFSDFTPIPLTFKAGKLIPSIPWKDLSLPEDPLEAVNKAQRLFSKGDTVGVAIKAGEISGLVVLDIDDPEKFEAFYPLERLIKEASYVVKTKDEGHYHIGFSWEPEFPESKSFLKEAGFEIKSNGSLVNFYNILPEAQYKPIKLEPLRPMPKELKDKILALMRRQKETPEDKEKPRPEGLDPSKIIELISEVYQKGQRQYWTIYTAGYLRKLGVPFEEAKEALEEFLRAQGDEELEMRLAGVEHTFREPLDKVKGLAGLLELGLSEEAYLRLNGLKIQKKEAQVPKYFSLRDILTLEVKEPSWIIPNLLPEGFSLLGGKPKIGKSWLALQVALTCVQLGKRVAYFALEDTPARLQKRLKVLGVGNPEALPDLLFFSFELPKIGKGAVKEIRECIQRHKPDLIIIDPWARIKPQARGKDLFLEEYQALEVFKEFQREGVNILLVHHARKSQSEDPIDEILGSTGQTAVVDNILVLKRGRGSQTAVLHLIPRDFEGADLGLRFENGWKLEGSAKEVMLAEEQRKIVETIRSLESMGEKATIKAIAELVGKSQGAVKVALFDLVQKGVVYRKERGVYSLLDIKDTKRANLTNLTNLTNFPNFPNFSPHSPLVSPEDPKVSLVSFEGKNELTIPAQNLQGLQEKVSLVSKVSSVNQSNIRTPTQTPDQTQTPTQRQEEEEVVFLLMPENEKCPRCNCEVWKVDKRSYEMGKGGGSCAKCGHISWFGNLSKGKILSKADVEYFLAELPF
jgi:DNA-binding transcriptional ArsR family regulator